MCILPSCQLAGNHQALLNRRQGLSCAQALNDIAKEVLYFRSFSTKIFKLLNLLLLSILFFPSIASAGSAGISFDIGIELRNFPEESQYLGQLEHEQSSLFSSAEIKWESNNKKHQLFIEPFVRWDNQDSERSHADLRESYYRYTSTDDWSFLLGIGKVFWGVAESRHLVDIINQSDSVENIDNEDKLGQPMATLTFLNDWGALRLFVLPGFRQRTFPGAQGRLRGPVIVDTDEVRYEASEGSNHVDYAIRYSHYFGDWDLGLSAFQGSSRAPRFALNSLGDRLIPIYDQITQFGVDIQYTRDAWLWKLEAITRTGQGKRFFASVVGIEYSFYQVFGSSLDVGLIVEYQYDGREQATEKSLAQAPFETPSPYVVEDNDIFSGLRFALNDRQDTSLLVGSAIDINDGSTFLVAEARRRLASDWTLEFEARFFVNTDATNLLATFRDDDSVSLGLTRRF